MPEELISPLAVMLPDILVEPPTSSVLPPPGKSLVPIETGAPSPPIIL